MALTHIDLHSHNAHEIVVAVTGEIDLAKHQALTDAVEKAVKMADVNAVKSVVIDLSQTSFLDSGGIRALVHHLYLPAAARGFAADHSGGCTPSGVEGSAHCGGVALIDATGARWRSRPNAVSVVTRNGSMSPKPDAFVRSTRGSRANDIPV